MLWLRERGDQAEQMDSLDLMISLSLEVLVQVSMDFLHDFWISDHMEKEKYQSTENTKLESKWIPHTKKKNLRHT